MVNSREERRWGTIHDSKQLTFADDQKGLELQLRSFCFLLCRMQKVPELERDEVLTRITSWRGTAADSDVSFLPASS